MFNHWVRNRAKWEFPGRFYTVIFIASCIHEWSLMGGKDGRNRSARLSIVLHLGI
jgi:hypothetical protein